MTLFVNACPQKKNQIEYYSTDLSDITLVDKGEIEEVQFLYTFLYYSNDASSENCLKTAQSKCLMFKIIDRRSA